MGIALLKLRKAIPYRLEVWSQVDRRMEQPSQEGQLGLGCQLYVRFN
jgi:hypothetical protein